MLGQGEDAAFAIVFMSCSASVPHLQNKKKFLKTWMRSICNNYLFELIINAFLFSKEFASWGQLHGTYSRDTYLLLKSYSMFSSLKFRKLQISMRILPPLQKETLPASLEITS